MHTPSVKIRAEVLNRLQTSIKNKESKETISTTYISELSNRLLLIDNRKERKELIKNWYKDLLSADIVRRHHLSYKNPVDRKELNVALSNLTSTFKKRFHTYFV
ncbi:MAG: hypothetical protein N4A46_12700 [Schleiferiaceae bacterium]|jgi:hypothetical protein|nr:hypothetical protein [Schleiferiaceae bacterium]